ncbi:MAG: hypothetical protein AB1726_03220 [Planctomycetota bacterium]
MFRRRFLLATFLLLLLGTVVVLLRGHRAKSPASWPEENVSLAIPEPSAAIPLADPLHVPPVFSERSPVPPPTVAVQTIVEGEGTPVAAAEIRVESGEILGTTDMKGELVLPLGSLPEDAGTLIATADGYLPGQADWAGSREGYAERVRIELSRGCSLGGTVRLPDGASPVADALVLAAEETFRLTAPDVERAIAGEGEHERIQVVRCDAGGAFVMNGLRPHARYRLIAGGSGCLSTEWILATCGMECEIVARPLYGMGLTILRADGTAIPGDGRLYPDIKPNSWHCEDDRAESALVRPWLVLLGLSGDEFDRYQVGLAHRLFLYASDEPLERLGPVDLWINIPGFQTATVSFDVYPLDQELRTMTVRLEQTAAGFGTLEVTILGSCLTKGVLTTKGRPDLSVQLFPLGEVYWQTYNVHAFIIPDAVDGTYSISGVPYGEYGVVLGGVNKFFSQGEPDAYQVTCSVSEDPARVSFDLSELGCARVVLVGPAGEEVSGPTAFRVHPFRGSTPARNGAYYAFSGPPQVLTALPPGRYQAKLQTPYPAGIESFALSSGEFSVEPGAETRLTIVAGK